MARKIEDGALFVPSHTIATQKKRWGNFGFSLIGHIDLFRRRYSPVDDINYSTAMYSQVLFGRCVVCIG